MQHPLQRADSEVVLTASGIASFLSPAQLPTARRMEKWREPWNFHDASNIEVEIKVERDMYNGYIGRKILE